MVLTKRQNDILFFLCGQREYVTIRQLAHRFDVSGRTIQNDLALISAFLSGSKAVVDKKPGKGIRINADEPEIYNLRRELDSLNNRILSNDERISLISLLLLCNPVNTFESLSNACCVSRGTVIAWFEQVERGFAAQRIEVLKVKGVGIKVSGDELRIRKYFENKLTEMISDKIVMNVLVKNSKLGKFDDVSYGMIESVEEELDIRFVESMKVKLLVDYSLNRIAAGLFVSAEQRSGKPVTSNREYALMRKVLDAYDYPDEEKLYFCSLFMNAKVTDRYANGSGAHRDSVDEAAAVSEYLFNKLQQIQPLDMESRERFIHGLTLHLRVAIYRIRNRIEIRNELLPQIKISIPLIYEFTRKELLKCEREFNLEFDENEIAFIAMYIDSAYENSFQTVSKLTVLIVCSFGIATSSILKTRILQAIPECNIVGPLSEKDAESYLRKNETDLVVAANDFRAEGVQTITVNPLLFQEDIDYIKDRLFQISYSMMCNHLIKSCASFEKQTRKPTYIRDYVAREDIQIADTCKEWSDAISLAAKPLVDKGSVEQRYVSRMVEAVEQFGTYMVLVPETAFIHAGTEDGINEDCSAILVLKNPIVFGSKNSKMVRNFVVLGIKNRNEDSLLRLIYIFENRFNLSSLASGRITVDAIYNMHD